MLVPGSWGGDIDSTRAPGMVPLVATILEIESFVRDIYVSASTR